MSQIKKQNFVVLLSAALPLPLPAIKGMWNAGNEYAC
jgi:hypothetical protein